MKPEARVEPDAKRTKLAEPKKEPKTEPHDPADEAPRLDREPKDDKTAALEADKRRRREKEERREKRRKEKSSKHEGMISRGCRMMTSLYPYKLQAINMTVITGQIRKINERKRYKTTCGMLYT